MGLTNLFKILIACDAWCLVLNKGTSETTPDSLILAGFVIFSRGAYTSQFSLRNTRRRGEGRLSKKTKLELRLGQ